MFLNQLKYYSTFSFLLVMAFDVQAVNYTAVPRWGQAATIISNTLLISGGKTDPQHQFTYSSAPNTNDILSLNLSMSFSMTSPPWIYLAGSMDTSMSQGPSVAFHTLTPFTTSELLLFGGDAGFQTIETNADSAWLLNVSNPLFPVWSPQSPGWASEPVRRIYHAAPSASGAVYIIGGQKADGSEITFPDTYVFNAVGSHGSPVFVSLSNSTTAPFGLYGHAAHILPDGSLMVFGGFFSSDSSPSVPSPLDTIYVLNKKSSTWSVWNASGGAVPGSRRGFASALLDDGNILIHGGADATLQNVFSDGAILDTTQNPMHWSSVDVLSNTLGPRVGHFAEPVNGRVLFGFGWAGNAPTDADLKLYDPTSSAFQSTFTPAPSPISVTTLPISPTTTSGTYPTSGSEAGITGVGHPAESGQLPSPTSTSGADRHSASSQKTGIVIGSLFGALSFAALAGGAVYYATRRHGRRAWVNINGNNKHDEGRWKLMPEIDPWDDALQDDSAHPIPTVKLVGAGWRTRTGRRRGLLGLAALVDISGASKTAPQRRDMLADEDVYEYDVDQVLDGEEAFGVDGEGYPKYQRSRRGGTHGSSFSFASLEGVESSWTSFINASVTSLRNIGVTLGVAASGADVAIGHDGRNVGPSKWRENGELTCQPYTEEPTASKDVLSRLTKTGSSDREYIPNSNLSIDSFADTADKKWRPISSSLLDDHDKGVVSTPVGEQSQCDKSLSPTPAPAAPSPNLTPIMATTSESQIGESLDSHSAPSSRTLESGDTSNDSVYTDSISKTSSPISFFPTSTLGIIDPPMRRSNSWWSRFGRAPFLDRHKSEETPRRRNSEGGLLDFRDPNPAPRLSRIEEGTSSNQTAQEGSPRNLKSHARNQNSGYAPSTKSSVKTGQTADSELIAGLDARMEVVQRALSLTSGRSVSPTATLEDFSDDLYRKQQPSSETQRSWSDYSTNESSFIKPSVQEAPVIQLREPRPQRRSTTGVVAERVSAYEKRICHNPIPHDGSSTPRTNTGQARRSVAYGFAPKSSLYVANPDTRTGST